MKTKNTIIALLLIGITVLGILYYNKCNESPANYLNDAYTLKNTCNGKSLCDTTSTCGEGIGKDSVWYISDIIKSKSRVPFNKIYGYQIGLRHIDEMYAAITAYNLSCRGTNEDTIAGIRIYEAISERRINGAPKTKADVVMIPYLSNCKDIYLVDDHKLHEFNLKMYTHFRPCPKLCGDESLYIHQR